MKVCLIQISDQRLSRHLQKSYGWTESESGIKLIFAKYLLSEFPNNLIKSLENETFVKSVEKYGPDTFQVDIDLTGLDNYLNHEQKAGRNNLNQLWRLCRRKAADMFDHDAAEPEKYGLDLRTTKIMAVLNITPDSFSDGGKFDDINTALEQAMKLIEEGADILDIGGESSRPGAQPVPLSEELARVIPVITAVRKHSDIPISIDTYKAAVARQALDAGADWINDISGLRYDPGMTALAALRQCPVIVMHMLGEPTTMQQNPHYDNVLDTLFNFFEERIKVLNEQGIDKIILDPGIGFGKRLEDNLTLLNQLKLFRQFGYPVLVGPSRKSFIGQITGREVADRLAGTLASVSWAAMQDVSLVRTHEVAPVKDALKIINQIL